MFEGWCVANNCDPLKEPSRRMISLMLFVLGQGEDGQKKVDEFLNKVEQESTVKRRHLKAVKDPIEKKSVAIKPKEKWRAPEGWTPPGWDEEKSFQVSKAFMGFQANPK